MTKNLQFSEIYVIILKRTKRRLQKRDIAKKTALFGVLTALAFVFSYVEAMMPFSFVIPGMKVGLANLVVVAALYLMGGKAAFCVSLVRIVLVGFTFGNLSTMMYSLSGGLLSFIVMAACKNICPLRIEGVSMAGGVAHNIGQLLVAALVMETSALLYYVPVLLVSGLVTGGVIGFVAAQAIRRIRDYIPRS